MHHASEGSGRSETVLVPCMVVAAEEVPDIAWYGSVSRSKGLPERCPFAAVRRCPRYYFSRALLGEAGVATSIEPAFDKELEEYWRGTDLWPATAEEQPSTWSHDGQLRGVVNFRPEVSFETFGWFASYLHDYSDEIDRDIAHQHLAEQHYGPHHPRWRWQSLKPLHYSECPLYSALSIGVGTTGRKKQMGFRPE